MGFGRNTTTKPGDLNLKWGGFVAGGLARARRDLGVQSPPSPALAAQGAVPLELLGAAA